VNSIYTGLFAGPYFDTYNSNYHYFERTTGMAECNVGRTTFISNGGLGGLTVGYLRKLSPLFSILIEADAILNSADSSTFSEHIPDDVSDLFSSFDLIIQYKIQYFVDLLLGTSININDQTNLFVKAGPTYTNLRSNVQTRNSLPPNYTLLFNSNKPLMGLAIQLGISRQLNSFISVYFAYMYRYFSRKNLSTLLGPDPTTPPRPVNEITRSVRVQSNAIYVGLNFKLVHFS